MKKLQRRAYQVNAARHALFGQKRRILTTAPGGTGKTEIIAQVTSKAVRLRLRVLVITHRRVIVKQIEEHLHGRVEIGFIMGNLPTNPEAPVQIASIHTLRNRKLPKADVIIIDEAHGAVTASYTKVLEHYKGKRILGYTASPIRLDGVGLWAVFDELYVAAVPSQVIGKYIMEAKIWSAKEEHLPALLGVKRRGGDYIEADLVTRVNKDGLVGGIVEHALQRLKGRTAIAFCVTIAHSKHVAAKLNEAGIKAAHIDGSMSDTLKDEILRQLEAGEIQVITCCLLLLEGWDLPRVEAVILARPTRSLAYMLQMCARCVRMSKRTPLILDHALNTVLHGSPSRDRVWTLDGEDRGTEDQADPRAKVCPKCQCVNEPGADVCEECGEDLPARVTRSILNERKELELAEWTKKQMDADRERVLAFVKEKNLPASFAKAVLQDLAKRRA